jgi:hypothetical protein
MTKPAFCCQVVVLSVLFSVHSHAATRCIRPTNFCDTVSLDTSGAIAYGNWDWLCFRDWNTTSVIGDANGVRELATRPYVAPEQTLYSYAIQFSFKPGQKFDLYGTSGLERGIVPFATDEPYIVTDGPCGNNNMDLNKPRLMSLNRETNGLFPAQNRGPNWCIHFTNFCDTVILSKSGTLAYGNWDWQCTGDYTDTPVIGNASPRPELTTRPGIAYGYTFPYSTQLSFKPGKLFDLYLTDGTAGGVAVGRRNQPYTITNGTCGPRDANNLKPRMMER